MSFPMGLEPDLASGAFIFAPTRGTPNQLLSNDPVMGAFGGDGQLGHATPNSTSSGKSTVGAQSPKPKAKKTRVTLARGAACVNCRHRKLKCTGEKPCSSCLRADIACQYEVIQRKRPRHVILEERVVELEALLTTRGVSIPPTQLAGQTQLNGHLASSTGVDQSGLSSGQQTTPLLTSETLQHAIPRYEPLLTVPSSEIVGNSAIELGLITLVLPHTPYLNLPLHPQRLLYRLSLPAGDTRRPHPALLYILFAEAIRFLEHGISPPTLPTPPLTSPSGAQAPRVPLPSMDPSVLLSYVRGRGMSFLERARSELDSGIRNMDRPLDLVRAATGIARYLHSIDRLTEAWHVPVSQLVVACGLHRLAPVAKPSSNHQLNSMTHFDYQFADISAPTSQMTFVSALPELRVRSVLIPQPEDEVDFAERAMTFWAARTVVWTGGVETSWAPSLADDECTTPWPWGWGGVELQPNDLPRFSIADLHTPTSELHTSLSPDTTFVLALKSLAILHRANRLLDLPPSSSSNGAGTRIDSPPLAAIQKVPLAAVQNVEAAIRMFRLRLPIPFQDLPSPSFNQAQKSSSGEYNGFNDPWWITLHANIYTAEMLMYKEMAAYQRKAYDTAVSCARALVGLVQRVLREQWAHVGLVVPISISLAARFLNKESQRLATGDQSGAAQLASEEAEFLRLVLARDISKYHPMAAEHALVVQRVKDGWPAKDGEFERA